MGDHTDLEARARDLEKRLTAVYDEILNLPDYAPLIPRKEEEYERLLSQYKSVQRDMLAAQGQISLFEEEA
jgi:hypothetical protein